MKNKVDHLRTRPPWCYDKKCKVILSRYNEKSHDQGYSSFCYGALPEVHIFKQNEVTHDNNMCHCYYTPLKGAIRFFTKEDDLWGEISSMIGVLNRRIKVKCHKCGKKGARKVVSHYCPTCTRKKETDSNG